VKRLYAVDLEGVDVLCIVAPRKAASLARTEPVVDLSESDFVIEDVVRGVSFHDPNPIRRRDRT
jgi:hypothetical protein